MMTRRSATLLRAPLACALLAGIAAADVYEPGRPYRERLPNEYRQHEWDGMRQSDREDAAGTAAMTGFALVGLGVALAYLLRARKA